MAQVKVLMTDSNEGLTQNCAEILRQKQAECIVCEKDGHRALAAIAEQRPDVVVLDAFMPGLDAISVKQRCEQQGVQAAFFVMGGFSDDALEAELVESGFLFYFLKPFDPEAMVQRVLNAVGRPAKRIHVPDDECTVTDILHQIGVPPTSKVINSCATPFC